MMLSAVWPPELSKIYILWLLCTPEPQKHTAKHRLFIRLMKFFLRYDSDQPSSHCITLCLKYCQVK